MGYITISEELRIQACNIEDLSQYTDGDLRTISLIYDPVTDYVILNQNHENYELYKLVAETFLAASFEERLFLRLSIMDKIGCCGDETTEILDKIAQRREKLKVVY